MIYKCPVCGMFVKNIVAVVNGLDEIQHVDAKCKKCGCVKITIWDYEDFFN